MEPLGREESGYSVPGTQSLGKKPIVLVTVVVIVIEKGKTDYEHEHEHEHEGEGEGEGEGERAGRRLHAWRIGTQYLVLPLYLAGQIWLECFRPRGSCRGTRLTQ